MTTDLTVSTAPATARATAPSDLVPPRRALALLIDPSFGSLFWGKTVSSLALWIHSIVAAIVVFDATGSALMVGLVSVAQFAPQLVLTPLAGKWSDAGHSSVLLWFGRLLCVAGSGGLALWFWLAPQTDGTGAAVPVLVASLMVGIGFSLVAPVMMAIVPAMVRPNELASAVALNAMPMTTSRIAGPAIGALVTAHFSAATAFGLAAGGHVLFLLALLVIRMPPPPVRVEGHDRSIRAAIRYVRSDRPLLLLLVAITAVGFGSEPAITLVPATAHALGGGAFLVGELATSFGIGAGIGIVIMTMAGRRVRAAWGASAGLWLLAAGTVTAGFSAWVWLTVVGFAVAGAGFSAASAGITTLVQERAPDVLRGRIMALWLVGFAGSRPVSAALLGSTADAVSLTAAFVVTAGVMAAVAVLCRPRALTDHRGVSRSAAR